MRTFPQFLDDRGFQADACEALEHPDFYRLAKEMHGALEKIAAIVTDARDSEEVRTMHTIATEALKDPQ